MIFAGCIVHTHSFAADMPQYTRTDYPVHDVARFVFTGSGNDDSRPDVIVVDKSGAINVLLAGPNAVYGTAVVTETGIKDPKAAIAEDFNNDGLLDICVNDTLLVASGNGEFATPRPLGIERLQTIVSTDMNGDGKKDLIAIAIIYTVPNVRAAELRTYFGNGDGTFKEPVKTGIVISSDTTNEAIDDLGGYYVYYSGDFTDDGVPDLVVRRRFCEEEGYVLSYNWSYVGNSDGTFIKNSFHADGNMYAMEVKDVNRDGIKDIIDIGHFSHILTGDNTGVFSYFTSINFTDDSNYLCFSVADVNGDGILDYNFSKMLSYNGDSSLSTALGAGDGYTGEKYTFPVLLPNNEWFASGWAYDTQKPLTYDFNNDGSADFIIPFKAIGKIAAIVSEKSTDIHEESPHDAPILGQNTPNPFNASTTIPYSIFRPGIYELAVYDMLGRKIVTLVSGFQPSGEHRVVWNVQDKQGVDVASGCYFYILKEKGGKAIIASRKLLLMK